MSSTPPVFLPSGIPLTRAASGQCAGDSGTGAPAKSKQRGMFSEEHQR
jgi:hypothetical protein